MKNGYSLLLFPTESLKQPWMLCGTRSKKKKVSNKIFLHTTHNYLHPAEYDENQKHKRTRQRNGHTQGSWASW